MLIHVHLVLLPVLLLLAALFAATEASLFSLTRAQLETLRESRPALYRRIRSLIFRPDETLTTIIIGNEFINIMIGTFVAGLLQMQFGVEDIYLNILLSVTTSSLLLLTCSEILPKIVAFRMPLLIASVMVYPMSWAHWLITPLRQVFMGMSRRALNWLGVQVAPPNVINEQDFLTLVEVGAESGSLDRDEKEMISNVFTFSDLDVSAIMTPWPKVFHLTEDMSVSRVLDEIRKQNFSRVPMVSADGHRVLGVLYTKALLRLLLEADETKKGDLLKEALFPPHIVSSHKKVARLFREFKVKKIHMALVVNEFGKHIGVVTLEDVLNSIFRRRASEAKA